MERKLAHQAKDVSVHKLVTEQSGSVRDLNVHRLQQPAYAFTTLDNLIRDVTTQHPIVYAQAHKTILGLTHQMYANTRS